MINQITISQINLYLYCSLKYKFQYVDNIPQPCKSLDFAFDSALYSALSWFHKEQMNGNRVTLERFYRIFNADRYSQKVETNISYKKQGSDRKLATLGKKIVALYFKNPCKNSTKSIIPFTLPLTNPSNNERLNTNLKGFINFTKDDNSITELKTSKQVINQDDANNYLKITAHSYAYTMLHKKPPKLLKIINIVKKEEPEILIFKTTRNRVDYKKFFHLAKNVLKAINTSIFFPRQSCMSCGCEYANQCKAWEGN